ncbi:MAG TPA: metal-dependent transcriptional regulator [Methanobacterium sp.]|nr:metal-dependent transcriptional regulator [Methanobacterium sp.]HOI40107.1 metal-dependent transcriptional regulator [Methanobacterium sp.]
MTVNSPKITRSVEDYLETMYFLEQEKGTIRVKDVAKSLGVKPPSVVEAVKKLSKMNMVSYERYGTIQLKEEGLRIGEIVSYRHQLLKDFLILLGVDEEVAEKDACSMEHVMDVSTLRKFKKFVEFIDHYPNAQDFLEKYREYSK